MINGLGNPAMISLTGGFYPLDPIFELPLNVSGTSNLSTTITVNSTAVIPDFFYLADDISGTTWTATTGDNLSETGTGDSATPTLAPFLDGTGAAEFQGGKYFTNASPAASSLADNDGVFEFIFFRTSGSNLRFAAFRDESGGEGGWFLAGNNSTMQFRIKDATTVAQLLAITCVSGWNHLIIFYDRSEATSTQSLTAYMNGVLVNHTDGSAVGDVTDAQASISLGGITGSVLDGEGLVLAAQWSQSGWFAGGAQNPTDWLAFSNQRFAQLTGIYPTTYAGTPDPTFTRATNATLDIRDATTGVMTLHKVPSGWPRLARRLDAADGYYAGYLAEPARTNLLTYSEDVSNGSWASNNLIGKSSNVAVAPNGETTSDSFIANGTSGQHGVNHTFSATNTNKYCFSVYAKAGNEPSLKLTSTMGGASFVLTDASLGELAGTPANTHGIENLGGGWCRCWINFTATSTSTMTCYVWANSSATGADSGGTYSGDSSSEEIYFWGAQIEVVDNTTEGPSSYIATTTAATTRNADALTYVASDGNYTDSGSMTVQALMPEQTVAGTRYIYQFGDGGASQMNNVTVQVGDQARWFINPTTGGDLTISTGENASDNTNHTYHVEYDTNNGEVWLDGVSKGTDTAMGLPDVGGDIITLGIGLRLSGINHLGGIVHDLKVYDVPRDPLLK